MTQAEKAAVLSLRKKQYSLSAIAETTGLPLGTIKSFLSRASGKKEASITVQHITEDQTCCRQCDATNAAGYVKQAIPYVIAQACQSAKNLPAVITSGPGEPLAVVDFLTVDLPGDWRECPRAAAFPSHFCHSYCSIVIGKFSTIPGSTCAPTYSIIIGCPGTLSSSLCDTSRIL